jgi:hypothetical protein
MAYPSDPRSPHTGARPLPYTPDGLATWVNGDWSSRAKAYEYSGLSYDEQPRAVHYPSEYGRAAVTALTVARQRSNGDLQGKMPDKVADEWLAALKVLRTADRVLSGSTHLSPVTEDGEALREAADRAAARETSVTNELRGDSPDHGLS